MDKYEYRVKLDEINNLVDSQDYEGALKIVEAIDWRRVKSARTLCMVGEIYEANKKYTKSKEILLLAYERAPIGKTVLYRLVELAIKMGDFDEAVEHYNEFVECSPNDNTKYILKYKIYRARRSPIEDQISILEEYKSREYTERWAYELARLYAKAGMREKCTDECDDLILWFSEGRFVTMAMELKMNYAPLTEIQRKKYENRFAAIPIPAVKPVPSVNMEENEDAEVNQESEETAEETDHKIEKIDTVETPAVDTVFSPIRESSGILQEKIAKGIRDVFSGRPKIEDNIQEYQDEAEDTQSKVDLEIKKDEPIYTSFENTDDYVIKDLAPEEFGMAGPVSAANLTNAIKSATVASTETIKVKPVESKGFEMPEELKKSIEEHEKEKAAHKPLDFKNIDVDIDAIIAETTSSLAKEVSGDEAAEQDMAAESEGALEDQEQVESDSNESLKSLSELPETESVEELEFLSETELVKEVEITPEMEPIDEVEYKSGAELVELVDEVKFISEAETTEVTGFTPETKPGEEANFTPETESAEEVQFTPETKPAEAANSAPESEPVEEANSAPETELVEEANSAPEMVHVEGLEFTPEAESVDEVEFMSVTGLVEEEELTPGLDQAEDVNLISKSNTAEEAEKADIKSEPAPFENVGLDVENEFVVESKAHNGSASVERTSHDTGDDPGDALEAALEAAVNKALEEELGKETVNRATSVDEDILSAGSKELKEILKPNRTRAQLLESELLKALGDPVEAEDNTIKEDSPDTEADVEATPADLESLPIEEEIKDRPEIILGELHAEAEEDKNDSAKDTADQIQNTSEFDFTNVDKVDFVFPEDVETVSTETGEIIRHHLMEDEQKQLFSYFAPIPGMKEQLVDALNIAQESACDKTSRIGNIIITGRQGTGKTRLSEIFIKALCKERRMEAAKMAYIRAEKLNEKDPVEVVAKLSGGFLVIEGASSLNEEAIQKLSKSMDFRTDGLTVILEDEKPNMKEILESHPEFASKFNAGITIPVFTNDELVSFAKTYAKEMGYKMDEMGVLALYTMIGDNQKEDEPITVGQVKEMVDGAIYCAEKGTRKLGRKIVKRHSDEDNRIILYEKDFDV